MKNLSEIKSDHIDSRSSGTPYLTCQYPLLAAADKQDFEAMFDLVENHHQDIEQKNALENTPLIIAASKGHVEMVEYLLSKGACVGNKNRSNKTEIDYLVKHPHTIDALNHVLQKLTRVQHAIATQIIDLDLSACKLHNLKPEQINELGATLAKLPNLKKLNLSYTNMHQIDHEKFTALCRLISRCKELKKLYLDHIFLSPKLGRANNPAYVPVERERLTELAKSILSLDKLETFECYQQHLSVVDDIHKLDKALIREQQSQQAYAFLQCYKHLQAENDSDFAVQINLGHLPKPIAEKILANTAFVDEVSTADGQTVLHGARSSDDITYYDRPFCAGYQWDRESYAGGYHPFRRGTMIYLDDEEEVSPYCRYRS